MKRLLLFILYASIALAQNSVIFGNSEVAYAPAQLWPQGWSQFRLGIGMTCEELRGMIPLYVNASTERTVFVGTTNDIRLGIDTQTTMQCLKDVAETLQSINPQMQVYLVNTPPWAQGNCYGDYRSAIAELNAAMAEEQWPPGVTVIDVHSAITEPSGWAVPFDMAGDCRIHPGPANQVTLGWMDFVRAILREVK